jgi:hypothetical protein
MERLGDKIDRNCDDIKDLSRSLGKFHHALVGNGDPGAFYTRLISVEHTVNKFQTFLEGLMDTQVVKMKEFDETLDKMDRRLKKMDERLDRLEKLEISIKGRVWGVVAVVSLVWSIVVVLLGWFVFK